MSLVTHQHPSSNPSASATDSDAAAQQGTITKQIPRLPRVPNQVHRSISYTQPQLYQPLPSMIPSSSTSSFEAESSSISPIPIPVSKRRQQQHHLSGSPTSAASLSNRKMMYPPRHPNMVNRSYSVPTHSMFSDLSASLATDYGFSRDDLMQQHRRPRFDSLNNHIQTDDVGADVVMMDYDDEHDSVMEFFVRNHDLVQNGDNMSVVSFGSTKSAAYPVLMNSTGFYESSMAMQDEMYEEAQWNVEL